MKKTLLLSALLLSLTACQNAQTQASDNNMVSQPIPSTPAKPNDANTGSRDSYNKTIRYKDFSAHVVSTPDGNGSYRLKVQPMDGRLIEKTIGAPVVKAVVGDLNKDGFYEILIFTQSVGSGSYGDVIAYSSNRGLSWSEVFYPELSDKLKQGYMGHDEFELVDNALIRRFPIYLEHDTNANPKGKMRQIQYYMRDGGASRRFVVDKVSEF